MSLSDTLDQVREELMLANRILAHEGVLDAFGHVSARHPTDPGRYLLSRSRGPELVEVDDILEFTLDSEPVRPPTARLYSERVIHGCIYEARPDVNAVVHHHAPAVLPYCITGQELVPVFHLGAAMGAKAPFWDSRDEFGDTNLLVVKPEEGRSLAKTLGPHSMVLMRRHGATVVGRSIRELVFRAIYSCRNAEHHSRALAMGRIEPLSPGEVEMAGALNLRPGPVARAWEYWTVRLEKSERATGSGAARHGRAPARKTAKAPSRAKSASRRPAGRASKAKARRKR
jgi:ribulose-5-phosphate 4-epimerase/fuculose-1-phosphate aldolase